MSDSILKFANKLEIRYSFNNKSNYMDAMTKHRCEKEILTLIRSLADMLDVKLTVYNEPYDKEGGFREKLGVAGESSRSISIVLNLVMQILTRPSLSVGGQPLMDRTPADEEEMQRELFKLRRELRLKTRFLKAGYRTLFYGPPGTGKTLCATLIGKKNGMDVYRIDLSMIVSKYIGETEKNLANVFDQAENRNWILFFDEADALFGKRTSTNTSNDRHSNQEIAYLLQRIEDFPGTVVLATNLKSNIDEAFSRRFQSIIYFPMPDQDLREELWRRMLPSSWLPADADKMIRMAATYELSGGSISNVIRRCALRLLKQDTPRLDSDILSMAIRRELNKEGRW